MDAGEERAFGNAGTGGRTSAIDTDVCRPHKTASFRLQDAPRSSLSIFLLQDTRSFSPTKLKTRSFHMTRSSFFSPPDTLQQQLAGQHIESRLCLTSGDRLERSPDDHRLTSRAQCCCSDGRSFQRPASLRAPYAGLREFLIENLV